VQTADPHSIVVTVIPATPAQETTIGDVVLGSIGVVGALMILALVLGVGTAVLRLAWNRLHPAEDDHLPPVSPYANGPVVPPSSRAR
jgi:hypothetical protein